MRRMPSGSGRHSDIQGAPSAISGAATDSSSTCWTMCVHSSFLDSVSIGVAIAITIVSRPP